MTLSKKKEAKKEDVVSSAAATIVPGKKHDETESKQKVFNTDMSEQMQLDALAAAREAFESSQSGAEKDVAVHIKRTFEQKYGGAWQCIVGRHFGSSVTHDKSGFLYFYHGVMAVLLFKYS